MKRKLLALALSALSCAAMALPPGATIGVTVSNTGAVSTASTASSTNVCSTTMPTDAYSFSAPQLKKTSTGDYFILHSLNNQVWYNTTTAGYSKIQYKTTATTVNTTFTGVAPSLFADRVTRDGDGTGQLVTDSGDILATGGDTLLYTTVSGTSSFRYGSFAVQALAATKGFKTTGNTAVTLTITCLN